MRVLLSDEQILVLEGLRNLLEARGIEVVGVAHSCRECIEKAREQRPDIILMDTGTCRTEGLSAIRLLKSEMPEVKVVILSVSADDHALFEAVTCGASGFLLKNMHIDDLVEALDSAAHDMLPLAPGMAVPLLAEFARLEEPRLSPEAEAAQTVDPPPTTAGEDEGPGVRIWDDHVLTARQREVLSLLAQGLSYKEVAGKVSLTPRTVKYHVGEIIKKLHLGNRAQVLAYAGRVGLASERLGEVPGELGPESPPAPRRAQGAPSRSWRPSVSG